MKTTIRLAAGALLGALSAPVLADYDPLLYHDCNLNGLNNIEAHDAARAEQVFYNRLANKGKGNGGEALYVFISGGVISNITCIDTPNEDYGGTLGTPTSESSPSVYLPEADPGNG
jgi:hypothetical protein